MGDVPPPYELVKPLVVPEKLLTGPGPSNVPPRIQVASTLPQLGFSFLHSEIFKILDDVKAGIQYAFQTKNVITFCIAGPGHAAMEAVCCNLVEPGDVVLVACNGVWSERFADMIDRHDGAVKLLSKPLGQVFNNSEIETALREHKPVLMFITLGESTGGTLQPMKDLGHLCHKYGTLLAVDAVASLGAVPLYMDRWGIDAVYTGAQKVLGAPPGISPISFSPKAWERIIKRRTKIRSYFNDAKLLANMWGCDGQPRKYHYTQSNSNIYALREGLAMLVEEGLEHSWQRHHDCTTLLHKGLEELGLTLLVKDPDVRLPVVTVVEVPSDIADWRQVSAYAMDKYQIEIALGLGAMNKVWRIGIMGHNATPRTVERVLQALKEGLEWTRKGYAKSLL